MRQFCCQGDIRVGVGVPLGGVDVLCIEDGIVDSDLAGNRCAEITDELDEIGIDGIGQGGTDFRQGIHGAVSIADSIAVGSGIRINFQGDLPHLANGRSAMQRYIDRAAGSCRQ